MLNGICFQQTLKDLSTFVCVTNTVANFNHTVALTKFFLQKNISVHIGKMYSWTYFTLKHELNDRFACKKTISDMQTERKKVTNREMKNPTERKESKRIKNRTGWLPKKKKEYTSYIIIFGQFHKWP